MKAKEPPRLGDILFVVAICAIAVLVGVVMSSGSVESVTSSLTDPVERGLIFIALAIAFHALWTK